MSDALTKRKRDNKLQGSFFDVVELEEIDINDPRAKFYLLDVADENGKNPGYKFVATVQDLSRLECDPESRKKHYWPVTREQLEKVDQNALFDNEPGGDGSKNFKLRTLIFKDTEKVNEFFHFDPPFNPLTTKKRSFGQQNITHNFRELFGQIRQQEPAFPINPDIRNLINQGFIMEREFNSSLTNQERTNLVYTHQLITKGLLTVRAAIELTNDQAKTLGENQIITLIEQGKLSIDEAKALNQDQCTRLYFTQPLISVGALTVQSALQLQGNDSQITRLADLGLVALIQQGRLTVNETMQLSNEKAFRYNQTQPLISSDKLTFDEAQTLTFGEVKNLKTPVVRDLILNDRLTINQAKQLTEQQISSLGEGHVDEVLRQLPPDEPEPDSPGSSCNIM